MSNPISTNQWSSYLDLPEVMQYLQFSGQTPPNQAETAILQRYIDSACTSAQNKCNRPIGPTQFQERHDGWSGEYIQLRWAPFAELVLCREFMSTGGFVNLVESTPSNPVEGIQIDYSTSRIMRVFGGYSWPRPFFPGSRNIEVTYKAGFNPVPPDLWEATMELIAWRWRNSQQASRSYTPEGVEYDGNASNGLWPGVPNRIADVFDAYRLPGIG